MASYNINAKSVQYTPVYFDIYGIPEENIGDPFEAPGTPWRKWPSECASGAKGISYGVRVMKIDLVVSKICYGQILSDLALYLSSNVLKNKFNVNPVEIVLRKDENLTSDLFCPIWSTKKGQTYGPCRPLYVSKSSSNELKTHSRESNGNL